ncbi:MAG: MFS transporter [Micromonosporaceae bacterium]
MTSNDAPVVPPRSEAPEVADRDVTSASAAAPFPGSFRVWLGGATVSAVGDGVLFFAIGWTAAGLGGQMAGLLLSLVVLPRTVLMLVGGAVGDRFGLRRSVIGCDVVMCGVLVTYLVAEQSPLPASVLLGGLALAIGTVSAFRLPASGALPRLFVTDDVLPRAMSVTGSLLQIARMVGPPLGGLVVVITGMTGAVSVNLLSFAVIVLVLVMVVPPYEQPPPAGADSTLRQIIEGLRAVRRIPGTGALLGAVALIAGSLLPVLSLCVPLAAREREWSATATGLVEATWIVGTLGVSLVVAKWGTWPRPVRPLALGPLCAGVGVLGIAVSPTPGFAIVGALVMGVGTAAFTTHVAPLYVLRTPEGMLARFQALFGVVQSAAILVVHNVLGAVAGTGGAALAMTVAAVLSVCAALVIIASPTLRAARTTTE